MGNNSQVHFILSYNYRSCSTSTLNSNYNSNYCPVENFDTAVFKVLACVFMSLALAAFIHTVYDRRTRPLSLWMIAPLVSNVGSLVCVFFLFYKRFFYYISCSVLTIAWLAVFVYELAKIGAYPSKLSYHKQIRPKLLWLGAFDGYVVKGGLIKNKFFENHDNLGKLFFWIFSWAYYLTFQLISCAIYGLYLLLHVVYWTFLLLIAMVLYSSHCFCSSVVWNTWLSYWTLSGKKFDSTVAIDTAFLNRSLMAQYVIHDVPMLIIFINHPIMRTLLISNLIFILRFVYYSFMNAKVMVSEAPFNFNIFVYEHSISPGAREPIKRRTHRTSKSIELLKSTLLDVLLKAHKENNHALVHLFKDDRKMEDMLVHEEVDPNLLKELTNLMDDGDKSTIEGLLVNQSLPHS